MKVERECNVISVSDDVAEIKVKLNKASVTIHTEWDILADGDQYQNLAKKIACRFREISKIEEFEDAFDELHFEMKYHWKTVFE